MMRRSLLFAYVDRAPQLPGICTKVSSTSRLVSKINHRRQTNAATRNVADGKTKARGALTGVKILDLSRVLAAPYATQILSDYGADVIKIEDVDRGDDTRYWRVTGEDDAWHEKCGPVSNYFTAVNRNKRSIALNLKHPSGKDIFKKLAKDADVVVENLRPGALDRLGIGYDVLKEINPRIILASTSGYGATGPSAQRAGYDMIAGAEAGLLHLTGERGRGPVRPGLGLTDLCTGLFMHGAIMGALYAREQTGRGQKLEGSLFETQVALLINVGLSWLNLGVEAERWGTQHPSVVPYDAFMTKEKGTYLVCGATNDKQFAKLVAILGEPDLAEDSRFVTNPLRVKNRIELQTRINDLFAQRTMDEWLQAFEGSGMPYAPINNMQRVFEHPQIAARGLVANVDFGAAKSGRVSVLGPAIKFSDTKATIRAPPPLHGEQTKDILAEIGVNATQLDELEAAGVVKQLTV